MGRKTTLRSVVLCCLSLWGASAARAQGGVSLGELDLRRRAVTSETPTFPQAALKARARGVAVVSLKFDEAGKIISLEVLEAPHPLIAQAVEQAVRKWSFNPPIVNGVVRPGRGKLTFYYVIEKGVGRVKNPTRVDEYLNSLRAGEKAKMSRSGGAQ